MSARHIIIAEFGNSPIRIKPAWRDVHLEEVFEVHTEATATFFKNLKCFFQNVEMLGKDVHPGGTWKWWKTENAGFFDSAAVCTIDKVVFYL